MMLNRKYMIFSLAIFWLGGQAGFATHGELQLKNLDASVKAIDIRVQGTEFVKPYLEQVEFMLAGILQDAKPKVTQSAITTEPESSAAVARNWQLHVFMPTPAEIEPAAFPFTLRISSESLADVVQEFAFVPEQEELLHSMLQVHIHEILGLEKVTPTEELPDTADTADTTGINNSHPKIASMLDKHPADLNAKPQIISAKNEIELRNLTPAVKSIDIRLRGSEREQQVLDDIHIMLSEILRNSRLSVVRVAVTADTVITPAIKIYENLEIIIQTRSPQEDGQPYPVKVTLQEKDKPLEAQHQELEYSYANTEIFYTQLRNYISQYVNLVPR